MLWFRKRKRKTKLAAFARRIGSALGRIRKFSRKRVKIRITG
jgi:hypothetical protein